MTTVIIADTVYHTAEATIIAQGESIVYTSHREANEHHKTLKGIGPGILIGKDLSTNDPHFLFATLAHAGYKVVYLYAPKVVG